MKTPIRCLGRVPPLTWATLRDAAARARMPFSRWAVDRLLAAALAETATPPASGTADTECRPCSSPPTQ
jgi:hypothetical protein